MGQIKNVAGKADRDRFKGTPNDKKPVQTPTQHT